MAKKEVNKRLYRSKKDRVIAGVCGGLGEYLDIDPVWIRIIMVILAFGSGIGIILYALMWILVPENPGNGKVIQQKHDAAFIMGVIITVIGVVFLVENLFGFLISKLWPLVLIIPGIYLIGRSRKK